MSTNLAIFEEYPNHECSSTAPAPDWDHIEASEHFVQFYEEDDFLVDSVADFFARGFARQDLAIIIATKDHRASLDQKLAEKGLNVANLRRSGGFICLDAAETLSQFVVEGKLDSKRFVEVVGSLVARATATGSRLRAFGEMVALLWADGNENAAIELEELWNDLGKSYAFALFCAYPMKGFSASSSGQPFAHICKAHSRVIPAESYGKRTSTADERLRTITILQQKAAALEAEITVRKEAEKILARREQELSDFLENATEAIHKVGADGTIQWANQAELEMLGFSAAEYVGRNIAEFHADPEVIKDIFARLSRKEKLHNYEARLKHKDGSIRYVAINSSVYWDADQFSHTKCFTRDITEQKRSKEILEKTVAERTAQLHEMLVELEAFSYSISHDMRSPLRAMHGYATALLEDYGPKLDSEAVLRLDRIVRSAKRLDLLIRDVLAYSKIAKGEIQLTPVALGPLVHDIVSQRPGLETALHCISVGDLHEVMGHEAYLTQCFTNLIDNALKFVTPGKAPELRIWSEIENDQVRIWVSDKGIGIEPEHYDRLFRIFGRVYSQKQYSGTGIGLAIVSKAVARMGGQVGFHSEFGKGTDFWFTLSRA